MSDTYVRVMCEVAGSIYLKTAINKWVSYPFDAADIEDHDAYLRFGLF